MKKEKKSVLKLLKLRRSKVKCPSPKIIPDRRKKEDKKACRKRPVIDDEIGS